MPVYANDILLISRFSDAQCKYWNTFWELLDSETQEWWNQVWKIHQEESELLTQALITQFKEKMTQIENEVFGPNVRMIIPSMIVLTLRLRES